MRRASVDAAGDEAVGKVATLPGVANFTLPSQPATSSAARERSWREDRVGEAGTEIQLALLRFEIWEFG